MRSGDRGWLRWRVPSVYALSLIAFAIAHPGRTSLIAGALITGAGLVIRAEAAGYLHKHESLARSGPYARTRNPLYLGSTLLWAGFAVATRSWIVGAMFAAYFLAFYPATIKHEEAELRAEFGAAFDEYAHEVPTFRPRLHVEAAAGPHFSLAQYMRNREYQAAIVAVLFFAVLCARAYWRS